MWRRSGNVLCGQSTAGQFEDLELAVGKRLGGIGRAQIRVMGQAGEDAVGDFLIEVEAAGEDAADGEEDVTGGFLFGNIAQGAGMEDALGVEGFIVHGDDQVPRILGQRVRISLMNSSPSESLRDRSAMTRSGGWARMACRAWGRSSASPLTSRSASRLMTSARRSRTRGWSSTSKIRARFWVLRTVADMRLISAILYSCARGTQQETTVPPRARGPGGGCRRWFGRGSNR